MKLEYEGPHPPMALARSPVTLPSRRGAVPYTFPWVSLTTMVATLTSVVGPRPLKNLPALRPHPLPIHIPQTLLYTLPLTVPGPTIP